jgi:hypothetical protein
MWFRGLRAGAGLAHPGRVPGAASVALFLALASSGLPHPLGVPGAAGGLVVVGLALSLGGVLELDGLVPAANGRRPLGLRHPVGAPALLALREPLLPCRSRPRDAGGVGWRASERFGRLRGGSGRASGFHDVSDGRRVLSVLMARRVRRWGVIATTPPTTAPTRARLAGRRRAGRRCQPRSSHARRWCRGRRWAG